MHKEEKKSTEIAESVITLVRHTNDIRRSSQYFQNSMIVNATPIRANQHPLNITKVMKTIFKTHSNVERFKRNNPTVIKAQTFIELILGIVDILQFGKRKFQSKMKE
uniref:Uncharacterized protein n=1 Tax=Glossina austeni TaxID=7395 RepID=A0A1A9V0I2_GLOAU